MDVDNPFTDDERRAWAPPDDLTVSEWADRYRVIPVGKSAEPGPWRTDRTPYLRAIMDAMGDDTTQDVIIMKTPQVGLSEASRNALGFWIDHDPAPCMIVFPTEPTARENLTERVIPMLESTPRLRMYMTGNVNDLKASSLVLRSMEVYGAHAASPASLATRPCRYVICDETDKYPTFSGKETDPIRLAGHRQLTYAHRRKTIQISTPTTKQGHIYKGWDGTAREHRFRFHLPCPGCGKLQTLAWARMRWGQGKSAVAGGPLPEGELERTFLATEVEDGRVPVWFECEGCDRKITLADRHEMLTKGVWISESGLRLDEIPHAARPSRLAFHITSLYSPWVTWQKVVGTFLRSRADFSAMMDFMNGWLGEPFEEEMNRLEANIFEQKANKGFPRGVVPVWARYLIAGADTGGRDAWYVIRAFGAGYRSRLIDWGHCHTLDELKQRVLHARFQVEGNIRPEMSVSLMAIDTGGTSDVLDEHASRTEEVYRFCVQNGNRVQAIKGTIKGERPVSPRLVTYKPPGGQSPFDVTLNLVNVHYFKDVLSVRIHEKVGGVELWQECQGIDNVYCEHMTSEHRVLERDGQKARMVWRPITKGRPNHLWDCTVYACAAADMMRVDLIPPDDDLPAIPLPQPAVGRTPSTRGVENAGKARPNGRGWVTRRPR